MDPVTMERPAAPGQATATDTAAQAAAVSPLAAALRHAATRAVLLAAVLVAAGMLFRELVTLVAAGVITVIVAIALSTVAGPLERMGIPRHLGALLGVLVLVGTVGGVIALVVPPLTGEVERFADRFPQTVDDLAGQVASITGGDAAAAGDQAERAIGRLSGEPTRLLGPIASFGLGVAGVLSAVVLILITAYYMAARPQPLVDGMLRLLPPPRRQWGAHVVERLRLSWTGWLRGVAVDMVVSGALLYAGLSLIGLDFAGLFAALSALLVVIPYFGAIIGGLPPVLLALTESPELALLTLGVYVIVQQVEGNLIVPLVMARAVKLHPAVIALGVVVVAQLFGIVGLFVAVPLLSAAVILVEELWVHPQEARVGIETPPQVERAAGRDTDGRWSRSTAVDRALGADGRRFLALMGLPALGLALAITTVTTYLPVLINSMAGPAVTGALLGAEGLLALFVPILVGGWSDATRTRIGRRMPFLLAATPVAVVALVVMPIAGSLLALGVALALFYVAYFTYYAPYRALYPDLVPSVAHGRSQGVQSTMREIGLGVALVSGGVLLGLWKPLPFLLAALVLSAITATFALRVRERADDGLPAPEEDGVEGAVRAPGRVAQLLRGDGDVRRIVLANTLWELTLAALKTFVVLYITVGLERPVAFASIVLGAVAAAVVAAALVSGRLADRLGAVRLMRVAVLFYAGGLLVPLLSTSPLVLLAVLPGAFAAGVLMTLPYSVLMSLMPAERHGAVAGLFESSRGLGVLAGPVLAGLAVWLAEPLLPATDGYAAVFGIGAAAVIASIPLLWRLRDPRGDPVRARH